MTGPLRKLGPLALLLALAAPAVHAQDIQAMFDEGVSLMRRGRDDEALQAFQRVLAADPSHEQAYELFKATEHDIWIEILTKQGDFELVGKRLMGLAKMGRMEKRDDADAIKALVAELGSDDPIARRKAIRQLAAEHGEYAVPFMLGAVADQGHEDWRVSVMQALTEMNTDVVLPLLASLHASDPFLRRNVALVLGYIGDPRAAGFLAFLASSDADGGVQQAARQSLERMGAGGSASELLLQLGEDYHMQRDNVLADFQYSDVVWRFDGTRLVSIPVARALYPDEMAKVAYRHALVAEPGSLGARAGIARAHASQMAIAGSLAAAGAADEEQVAAIYDSALPLMLAGADAAEAALIVSVQQNDYATAGVLCHVVGNMSEAPTAGLRAALRSGDAALASEAAISTGAMCLAGKARADAELVDALSAVASRAVVRIAIVIDANAGRAAGMESALAAEGVSVTTLGSGAEGLGLLRRVAGVDAVIIAETLPDLTAHQVIDEVSGGTRTAGAPILIVSDDTDAAGELFGESVTVIGGGDAAAVVAAMGGDMNAGRARADRLAGQAADILAGLAASGQDVSPALDGLAASLAGRPDSVTIPAAEVLGLAGGPQHAGDLLALLGDTGRSDEARAAAGFAAAALFQRGGTSAEAAQYLMAVIHSDAARTVRKAAYAALGSLDLTPAQRAELLTGGGHTEG